MATTTILPRTTRLDKTIATIEDLYQTTEKAEIVQGEIRLLMPTGRKPTYAAFEIAVSLRLYIRAQGLSGIAVPDNAGFVVNLPSRRSFSPDAAYYVGSNSGMKFFEGAPQFAAEIRSEGDYGTTAEQEMRDKRADYFAAGTLVVWDVDLLTDSDEPVVKKYSTPDADTPSETFTRNQIANAEPAVPGWTMLVNDLFE
jgi:Uma2 family endonuclease